MRSGGRGSEAGGKDIPMAAQGRLLKFEFLFQVLVRRRRNHRQFFLAATADVSAFDLFLAMADWCRCVATSQSLLSYPSSTNSLSHDPTSIQPSLHLSTFSNATFPAFSSQRFSLSFLFFFPFFSFLCSAYLLYTGVLYVLR